MMANIGTSARPDLSAAEWVVDLTFGYRLNWPRR